MYSAFSITPSRLSRYLVQGTRLCRRGPSSSWHRHPKPRTIAFLGDGDNDAENKQGGNIAAKSLGHVSSPARTSSDPRDVDKSLDGTNVTTNQVFMITQEMKRTMIEELGYKRKEVDTIRVEIVANIIKNRIRCPSEGMPADWIDADRESIIRGNSSMIKRLESESRYPLKFPLLGIGLVLFGKGFSDALITLIKVNIDFPGASLTTQFRGIPVLAIDIVCAIVGAGLGLWTWKTMK